MDNISGIFGNISVKKEKGKVTPVDLPPLGFHEEAGYTKHIPTVSEFLRHRPASRPPSYAGAGGCSLAPPFEALPRESKDEVKQVEQTEGPDLPPLF